MALYQYFIEVVPTDVETFFSQAKTYQYSVKDNIRIIDHSKGMYVNFDEILSFTVHIIFSYIVIAIAFYLL